MENDVKVIFITGIICMLAVSATILMLREWNKGSSNIDDMLFSNNYGKMVWLLDNNNITIVYSEEIFSGAKYMNFYNNTEFLEQAKKDNVTYILSDYKTENYPYPRWISENTMTINSVSDNHFWYYVELPNIGKAAILYTAQESWRLKYEYEK